MNKPDKKKHSIWQMIMSVSLVALAVIFAIYLLILITPQRFGGHSKISMTRTEISNLSLCLGEYKNDYGIYPDDTSSETVVNALTGYKSSPDTPEEGLANDRDWHGPYLETQANQHDLGMKNKAMLDLWRQPYHFRLRHPVHNIGGADIWSSGPNMKDEQGEGDDICNWR